jgi:hypothetical protein
MIHRGAQFTRKLWRVNTFLEKILQHPCWELGAWRPILIGGSLTAGAVRSVREFSAHNAEVTQYTSGTTISGGTDCRE